LDRQQRYIQWLGLLRHDADGRYGVACGDASVLFAFDDTAAAVST